MRDGRQEAAAAGRSGFFRLAANGTTVGREIAAGVATFLTMVYIVVVSPSVLADAGVPFEGALFATCVSSEVRRLVWVLAALFLVRFAYLAA